MNLDRRTFLGCACALAAAGCASSNAQDPQTFTVPAGDVPVGSGTVFADRGAVVTQPKPGEYHAFSVRCPHQGCAVSRIRDGAIECGCHGSKFDVATGAVLRGPAREGLEPRTVNVSAEGLTIA